VIDIKNGINPADLHLAKWLRQRIINVGKNDIKKNSDEMYKNIKKRYIEKVLLIGNKSENENIDVDY
jgi:predicted GTPase